MIEQILEMYENLKPMADSKVLNIISRRLYRDLPEEDDKFISLCDELVCSNNWILYQIMTLWIRKRETVYQLKYFGTYEKWLIEYTRHWGACDQYCYRVLNPMIEKFPELFLKVIEWTYSEKIYVKRASAVCLLKSKGTFEVNAPFDKVYNVVEALLLDEHHHVQKGIGWLLKYTYLSYPQETIDYLKHNKTQMSRMAFRYALEKMPEEVRTNMMSR